jgi:pimeloyl-ACP methyl ester carboxylesterase
MTPGSYSGAPNRRVSAANGVEYAYRETGDGAVPLVLLQHFRGNLDNWDPALVDALASAHKVVAFDNVGVGGSSGVPPSSARSFVTQEIALSRPEVVRRVILASAAPEGAQGMHGWAPEVIHAVGKPETSAEEYLSVFFAPSDASRQAGREAMGRMYSRQEDRDKETTWETRLNQYDAVCSWGVPNHALLQKVGAISVPVFIANGDSDPMILPHYSYLLAGLIPQSSIKIYPDSAHGFLFQHHAEFAADVTEFLAD